MLGRKLLIIVCLCTLACDQQRRVMFIGDSLTTFPPQCTYPTQWAARYPAGRVTVYNEGVFGSLAHEWLVERRAVPLIARHPVDVVVIALGSNDIGKRRPPMRIATDLGQLRQQVATATDARGRRPRHVYVATVPQQYNPPEVRANGTRLPPEDVSLRRINIALLNSQLRSRFPAEILIDFDSWMPEAWDASLMFSPWDGIHFGCAGQAARAEAAEMLLGTRR